MKRPADVAARLVETCIRRGATAAEVIVRAATEFSVSVRLGEVETLSEADSKAVGLRVLVDGRQASVSTSDFAPSAVEALVDEAIVLARASSVDESAALPDAAAMAADLPDLDLYDDAIAAMSADAKLDLALRCEEAAREVDPRIVNFDRGGFGTAVSTTALANSTGFAAGYRSTTISLSTVPVAREGDQMQRDYWYDVRRRLADLDTPEAIGRRAAERALRKLGARKVATREVPVAFEPHVARDFLGTLFQAVSGESVFRRASFLVDRLEERVAAPELTIVDDGRIARGIGSRPFDGEALPTRRTVVVRGGVLESYLLNTYTGRKLGLESTGNASRGLVGPVGIEAGNLFVEPGSEPPDRILASIKEGFLVTELMGFGVNIVNGDYSRGASGIWIENGELAYPVEEVTIASNLKEMLRGLEAVGDDLEFRGRMAAPTLLFGRMSVSGR